MDDMQRRAFAEMLALRDMVEFLMVAYLDEKPPEAREAIMSVLRNGQRELPEKPVSDHAAEIWADIAVLRLQAVERSLSRVQAWLDRMPPG